MPESAISDLRSIRGGQGYLVFASADSTLNVTGETVLRRFRWRSDSFNFVGFPVASDSPPTFAAWFAGSTAQQSGARPSTYLLDASGFWRPVLQPEITQIQPGVAYWIFCRGGSDYQGPLDVSLPRAGADGRLDFGTATERLPVTLRNTTTSPIRYQLELSSADALPLTQERTLPGQAGRVAFPIVNGAQLEPLEPGAKVDLQLALDRAQLSATGGAVVLTVRDEVGSQIRIPVTAKNP
jgi:hypothetical protein